MPDYTVRPITEMETVAHGVLRRAAAELGVQSFGMQVLELPAGFVRYPERDHADDGSEEVYVVRRGSPAVEIDGERVPLDAERMLRVGPAVQRRLLPEPHGVRIRAIGAVPGKAFQRPAAFRLGAPDPAAGAERQR